MFELYQLVKIESKEIEAFLEAIAARETYESKRQSKEKEKRDHEEELKNNE
jgi:hypothetical protein